MSRLTLNGVAHEVKITGYRIVLAERAGVSFEEIGRGLSGLFTGGGVSDSSKALEMIPGIAKLTPTLLRFLVFACGQEEHEREFLESIGAAEIPLALAALFDELSGALPTAEDTGAPTGNPPKVPAEPPGPSGQPATS
jgi:hypothetical protein